MRKEPNERKAPELSDKDWAMAVQWRPYVYQLARKFGANVMAMDVWLTGDVMKNTHRWITSGPMAYGIDAVALMEDLEARAFEAAAVAAHNFDETQGYQFSTYLTKVVVNQLRDDFDRWVQSSTSKPEDGIVSWQAMGRLFFGEHDAEGSRIFDDWDPQYEMSDPMAPLPEATVLTPEVEAKLENAMGVLSSKEAWALRMHADGVPADVITERLGYKDPKSVYRLIDKAKAKARKAFG